MSHLDHEHHGELPKGLREIYAGPADDFQEGVCLDDELLAAWLDQTLSDEEHTHALKHLTRCRCCQTRLVALYQDIVFAWSPEAPLPVVEERMEGLVLGWLAVPSTAGNGGQSQGERAEHKKSKDGNGSDDEERKRRFVSGQS